MLPLFAYIFSLSADCHSQAADPFATLFSSSVHPSLVLAWPLAVWRLMLKCSLCGNHPLILTHRCCWRRWTLLITAKLQKHFENSHEKDIDAQHLHMALIKFAHTKATQSAGRAVDYFWISAKIVAYWFVCIGNHFVAHWIFVGRYWLSNPVLAGCLRTRQIFA